MEKIDFSDIFESQYPDGCCHTRESRLDYVRCNTESPIETRLAHELISASRMIIVPHDRFFDWNPEAGEVAFAMQLPVGQFRLDMAVRLINRYGAPQLVAIECDGEAYHTSRADVERDRRKDAYLTQNGWQVWRYPGWVIHNASGPVADEIERAIDQLRSGDNPTLVFTKNHCASEPTVRDYEAAFHTFYRNGVWPDHLGPNPRERGWVHVYDIINQQGD